MHYFVSILVLQILKRKRKLVALLLLSYMCIVTIYVLDALGWSAVCGCGIS